MDELLRVEGLSVTFGSGRHEVQAVRGASFCLHEGETLVLAGESGSGKTVATLALTRVLPASNVRIRGRCDYRGRELLSLDDEALSSIRGARVAYIFQEPAAFLNPVFCIGRQIAQPLMTHRGMTLPAALREAARLLERVKIGDPERVMRSYPHQLSGGMNQRAMTAMAVACSPDILIADEPTTALDVTTEGEILALLMSLKKELSFTLLFITHNLGIAHRIADRVIVMYKGEIVEEGGRDAVFSSPRHEHTRRLMAAYERIGRV